MKNKIILITITCMIIIAGGIILLSYNNAKRIKGAPAPAKMPVTTTPLAKDNTQTQEQLSKEIPLPEAEKIIAHTKAPASELNILSVEPREIKLEVEEGQKLETIFNLINQSSSTALINIYKSDTGESEGQAIAKIDELIKYKTGILSDPKTKNNLAKAALFTGTPWMVLFPYQLALPGSQAKEIHLTIDARELKLGQYATSIIVLGMNKDESIVIPVLVNVVGAPNLQLDKIEIDDGDSPDTKGNSDKVANPQEIIALTVYLKNTGKATAEGLSLELTPVEPVVKMINPEPLNISVISPGEETKAKFYIEIEPNSNSKIPPSVILEIKDRSGKKWAENFYLGEPGKFPYPTGLNRNDKKIREAGG